MPVGALILIALAGLTTLAVMATRDPAPARGAVAAEHTVHEFGPLRMQDGVVLATFPLVVEGGVDAVDLRTS